MGDQGYRYAGWFTLDVRLCATACVFSIALAVLVLALGFRGRRWDEYVVGFLAVFSLGFAAALIATNTLAGFPALRIETFFPVP